jgi:hypothetical protein
MINAFRNFNPLSILWLVVILIILRVSYLFTMPDQFEVVLVESFARQLIPWAYENSFSPGANLFMAGLLVLGQSLLLNFVVNQYNLLGKPSFLPALMYITLSSLFTSFLVLSPPLICNFLLIWMLFKLLSLYKSEDAKSTVYDLGMITAVCSLIYLPYIYLFLAIWTALLLLRPFNWREWVAGIFGYITVFFFLAVYYYLNDQFGYFYKIWIPLGTKFPQSIHINYYKFLLLIPVALILVLSFFKLRQNFFKSYVHVRRSFQLLFIIFLIAGLSFYVKSSFRLNHFLMCAVPAAIFFAYYFLYAAKRWFYDTLFILLLAGIIYFQFNTF